MDVYGKHATSEAGRYFRRNVWGWRPLADLILDLCPLEASGCEHWHSNDGDGLDAAGSRRLAEALEQRLEAGHIAEYGKEREAALKALPNEPCRLCHGTGIRADKLGVAMGQPDKLNEATTVVEGATIPHPRAGEKGWCNGCEGRGWSRPSATWYYLEEKDVRDFVAFLKDCGGFEIC